MKYMATAQNNLPATQATADWERLKEEATYALKSGLLPAAINTPEKAIAIALMGKELGLPIMASLTGLFVVNGKVQLSGALMLRLIYERVPGATVTVLTPMDKSMTECVVEMSRPNQKAMQFRYTIEEAKKAGFLTKQPWQQHPATMLRWSAIRTGARIVFADALAGCYMEDEVERPAQHIQAAVEPVLPEPPMGSQPTVLQTIEAVSDVPVPPVKPTRKPLDPDFKMPFGSFKGTRLKDKSREEWAAYALKTEAKIDDPAFPESLKEDALHILSILEDYLGD